MLSRESQYLIEVAKTIDLDNINSSDENVSQILKTIYVFIKRLYEDYDKMLEKLLNSNVRFSDYYDVTMFHGQEILDYFENAYDRPDKEELKEVFALYVVIKNAVDLLTFENECSSYDELYEVMNFNSYFEDLLFNIEYLEEKRLSRLNEKIMGFLNPNNKYKIYFTGLAYKDILKLEKHIKKSFINKISGHLSTSDVIPLAEEVDHVKELYNLSLFRIQFADDYRIAYVRRNGVTAIVGVTLKTGKESDYTRYDYIAKNKKNLYSEIDRFELGMVSKDSDHKLVIEHLDEFYRKIK